ncbi:hypothetical protein [Hymenobacter negativus]|uniref:Lipoprotein n=1 Tax=Hymenobacter negativus TaxID=2795026 RepID=A0ABS3QMY3_9BACT|nr:hypothetical protein [Hymenobacter negativus]MBO2012596.1 hypothetical protein [Hymenobacter negativus]
MKSIISCTMLAVTAAMLTACSSSHDPAPDDDSGCSETLVVPVSTDSIGAVEALTSDQLFDRNGIDRRNFRYVRYLRDSTQTYFPPYAKFNQQSVMVEEYINGLPLFTGNISFLFKNGVFSFRGGNLSGGTSLSTTPALQAGQVRSLFFATTARFDPSNSNVREQCVSAQFGYYNLNAGSGNQSENLVKAWKIKVKNADYPFAYYQDNGGLLIYYDNGIRTFR